MESSIALSCFKVASSFPLMIIAQEYAVRRLASWKDYIILEDIHIEKVLKCRTYGKKVYIFRYGCITFVNFDEEEIHVFLEQLGRVVEKIDYNLFWKYYERHILEIDESEKVRLTRDEHELYTFDNSIVDIISIILARSVALYRVEVEAARLVDEAERYINYLRKGKIKMKVKEFSNINARMMRFEYEMANSIKILDKPEQNNKYKEWKVVYNILEGYYEISERVEVIENKIDSLRRIIRNYFKLSSSKNFVMQYRFESLLLALFPMMYVIKFLIRNKSFENFFSMFFK